MTNGQLSLEASATALAKTVLQLIDDIERDRELDKKAYTRLAQSNSNAFYYLRFTVTNSALTKVVLE